MCGIAGIYSPTREFATTNLESMLRQLEHRGPDDRGIYISPDHRCALGHARLSIIDLSAAGRQPFANENKDVWVVCNGEIYNSPALRKRLIDRGHRFRSGTDVEVIVHLYEEYGDELPQHLDGMFAFALYDSRARRMLLARDRLGKKPLFYAVIDDALVFASELRALLCHPSLRRELDLEGLGQYLAFRTTAAPRTLLQNVSKVPPASMLVADSAGVKTTHRYWSPFGAAGHEPMPYAQAVETVRGQLRAAVGKRLLADVPVTCFLSGGLDSSAIVALMAEHCSDRIDTFTVRWADRGYEAFNEDEHASLVARHFGTRHHVVSLERAMLFDYLQSDDFVLDEPLADSVTLPLHYLSAAVRQAGHKVVMAGEGSDELFLGYESRLHAIRSFERGWRPLLSLPGGLRRLLARFSAMPTIASLVGTRFRHRLELAASGREVYSGGSASFVEEAYRELVANERLLSDGDPQRVLAAFAAKVPADGLTETFVRKVINLDVGLRLPELLLARLDRLTMRQSVEARAPFMDQALVETAVAMPYRYKIGPQGGKRVLTEACKGLLPDAILGRRKQIFGVPMVSWVRSELHSYFEDVIFGSGLRRLDLFDYDYVAALLRAHKAGVADNVVRIWILFVLSRWYDRWIGR
jgi:asparagine synthase (glutamine-hydrolysing)